jgi:hypothetical protein
MSDCVKRIIACPTNDECTTAKNISHLPFSVIELTCDATLNPTDPVCAGIDSHSVWFKFEAPRNMRISANTILSNYDTTLAVYTGNCGALIQVDCDDDGGIGQTSIVFFDAIQGETYFFKASGFSNQSCGKLFLSIFEVPPGITALGGRTANTQESEKSKEIV